MRAVQLLFVAVLCGRWTSRQCLVSADDVFASSAQLRLLADAEQFLVDALTDYLATERRRLLLLDQSSIIHHINI